MTRRRSIRLPPAPWAARPTTFAMQSQAVGARPLRVELDAEHPAARDRGHERARHARSRRGRLPRRRRRAARPRTSGRSRSPRRPRCRRTRGASRSGSTWFQPMWGSVGASTRRTVRPGRTPSVSAPSSSLPSNRSWSPRQMPRNGRSAAIQARIGSTNPARPQPVHRRRRPPRRRARRGGRRRRRHRASPRDGRVRRRRAAPARSRRGCPPRSRRPRRRPARVPVTAPLIPARPSSTRRRSAAGRARTRRAARARAP